MRSLEEQISPLIESQFPSFYQEEGPLFILFVKEYFKWLESDSQAIHESRKLLSYRDIDLTVDEFLVHFKEKYLNGVEFDTYSSKRKLIKAAQDIFRSKGTERSIDLLFKVAYGTSSNVYIPGSDILKPSDGTWVVPRYLELTRSSKTPSYVGKQITGSKSQATAFVEYLITRNINGKLIDVIYLTNIDGDFETGDIITTDGIIENSPRVTGSLTSIDITSSGQNFLVGEVVNLVSNRGVEGKARITGLSSETGLVSFEIVDGGWGYSVTANTLVSSKVLTVSNTTNSNTSITNFDQFETVEQRLFNLSVNNSIGEYSVGDTLTNSTGALSTIVRVQQSGSSNTANLTINPISGNTFANSIVFITSRALIATNTQVQFNVGDIVRQRTGTSNTAAGLIDNVTSGVTVVVNTSVAISSNGIHVGNFAVQANTGATGIVKMIPREDNFDYDNVTRFVLANTVGVFNNTDVISTYTDESKAVYIANTKPELAETSFIYEIIEVSGSSRWSTSNTILNSTAPTINTAIKVASDIGGTFYTNSNITATGVVMGTNSISVGVISVNNTFYPTNNSIISGRTSNTFANLISVSTGVNADFDIGLIENVETVRVSPDFLTSNNDFEVPFNNVLLTGANSGYGVLTSIYVFDGGSGYDNTNLVVLSGGNTGVGSFGAGNASITTDSSGTIVSVTISSNTGSGDYVSTPTVAIVNSSGGSTGVGTGANVSPFFGYGFNKLPFGDGSSKILDLLTFEVKSIGKISSLTNINPGENYNTKPFVYAYEPAVASLGKKDIILEVTNIANGPTFTIGEVVTQVINTNALLITSNNYSGNTGYEVGEAVTVYNGANAVGSGILYSTSYDISSNSYTLVITDTVGSFTNNFILFGETTFSNSTIIDSEVSTASSTARGRVSSVVSNTTIYLSRESLFTEFTLGGAVVGTTSGVTATVSGVAENDQSLVIGGNALISANVVTSNGSIASLTVINSGFGYEQDETVQITSDGGLFAASGKVNLGKQGVGEGFYSSTRGFLSNNKYIHDGNYYQEYSYEVQSSIPFERYEELLKQLLHVSGTKMFGRFVSSTVANANPTMISNIQIS